MRNMSGKNNPNWRGGDDSPGNIKVICETCGKTFITKKCYVKRGQMKYCSHNCRVIKGSNNPNWKGGRRKHCAGYVQIYAPNHPYANKAGAVLEHRLVIEKILGRYLKKGERVHHLNGKKHDNRPENLVLFGSESEHQKHHWKEKKNGKL